MRKIAGNSARILLIAIALFVLGPEFGALDIDGDGVPDVPIMVDCGTDQEAQPRQRGTKRVDLATASPFFRLICGYVQQIKARIVLDLPASRLSLVPLRC